MSPWVAGRPSRRVALLACTLLFAWAAGARSAWARGYEHCLAELHAEGLVPAATRVLDARVQGDRLDLLLDWGSQPPPELDERALEQIVRAFLPAPELGLHGVTLRYRDHAGREQALTALLPPIEPVPPKPWELSSEAQVSPHALPIVVPVDANGARGGFLSGRHVYLSQGHGWTWTQTSSWQGWRTQRGNTWGVVEDFLNAEAINQYLLAYLERAGATVWPMREVDMNPHMVIVDDGDGLSFPSDGRYEEIGEGFQDSTAAGFQRMDGPLEAGENPLTAGGSRVHYASPLGGAYARWTPQIPVAGRYRVTISWAASDNRCPDAHVIVRHAGGERHLRVDQRRHGNTWVSLGTYTFLLGSDPTRGSVEVHTDSEVAPGDSYVSLDAVRFGGGEGLVRRGTGTGASATPTSERPRYEECCRYAAQFNGAPESVYDYRDSDGSDDVVARSRYAAWQHENGEDAVYVSWHTNAPAPGRGTSSYVYGPNGPPSPFSEFSGAPDGDLLAQFLHQEVLNDIANGYDASWKDRGLHSAWFGELNPEHNPEMPAALIEVGFHDTEDECLQLQDPKLRNLVARAFYQGIARYFASRDAVEVRLLPEPPRAVRVEALGSDRARLSWLPAVADDGGAVFGDPASGFIVYRSADGRAFDEGTQVGGVTSVELDAPSGAAHYFRVTAVNEGGESFATPTLALFQPPPGKRGALIVGGFDRLDRHAQLVDNQATWGNGLVRRMDLSRMNNYDYVRRHAQAFVALSLPFDSAWHDAITSPEDLARYAFVDWFLGEESSEDETFSSSELAVVESYVAAGGSLFASGAELGWDLVELGAGDEPSRFRELFHADYVKDDADTYHASLADGVDLHFDDGTGGSYDVDYADVFAPLEGAQAFLWYDGEPERVAGTLYATGEGRGVALSGVPLEAVIGPVARAAFLEAVISGLGIEVLIDDDSTLPVEPSPELALEVVAEAVFEPSPDASDEGDVGGGAEFIEAGSDLQLEVADIPTDQGQIFPDLLTPVQGGGGGACSYPGDRSARSACALVCPLLSFLLLIVIMRRRRHRQEVP